MVLRNVTAEIPAVATYHLAPAAGHELPPYRFRPGQFNMLYLPGIGEVPISLSADPAELDAFAHTVRSAGNVTRCLARLQPGAAIGLRGPFGSVWPLDVLTGWDILLVVGGIGLAPLRPAIYQLLRERPRYGRLTLLYGVRDPNYVLFQREFDAWRREGLEIEVAVNQSAAHWRGHVGNVTLLVDRYRTLRPSVTALLMCGPELMMKYSVRAALQRDIAADHVWLSLERNMQCAVGFCGHCQLGPEFVCQDGPVFRYDRVAHLLQIEGL